MPKPSDRSQFYVLVFEASKTTLTLEQFIHCYRELLDLLYFNPEIDLPSQQAFGGVRG